MESPEPLTERQRSILDRIVASVAERGFPPSVRELSAAEWLVASAVHYHLKELQRKGRIRRAPGVARGIQVLHLEAVPPAEVP